MVMGEQEILKNLVIILRRASYNSVSNKMRFYLEEKRNSFKFSNRTVMLLLALSQKVVSKKEQDFFWATVAPSPTKPRFIKPAFILPRDNFQFQIRNLVAKYQDFIFMLFLKNKRVDEALNIIGTKEEVSSRMVNLLLALFEVLVFEPNAFNNLHLDKILSIVKKIEAFIGNARIYLQTKAESQRQLQEYERQTRVDTLYPFLPSPKPPSFNTDWKYEYVETEELKSCEDLLKKIQNKVDEINENRLASVLLEGVNLEISQDQKELKGNIEAFSFNKELAEIIDKIDKELSEAEDKFDFKSCMDLIRAFFNALYISIALIVQEKTGITPAQPIEGDRKMGKAMSYLRDTKRVLFMSPKENGLVEAFNSFLSWEGVHVLKSEKEHVRISKNMAIELGLFLVKKLKKYIAGIEKK